MLVYHCHDEMGRLTYHNGVPRTITVSPRWAPPSRLPEGPRYRVHAKLPGRAPSDAELDEVIDHVHAWDGWIYNGREEPCSRSVLRMVLRGWPHVLADFRRAIKIAGQSGVIA